MIPPSPEEPGIKKEVNGQPEATLKERYEEFTYKVTTSVPRDATAFSVSDTLVPVLEFSGEKGQATATLDGQEIDANRINVADQTISMALTEDEVKANGGKEVTLTFKAKIREGANLSAYIEKGKTSIPNTASYTAGFPNRPEIHKDSNRVLQKNLKLRRMSMVRKRKHWLTVTMSSLTTSIRKYRLMQQPSLSMMN